MYDRFVFTIEHCEPSRAARSSTWAAATALQRRTGKTGAAHVTGLDIAEVMVERCRRSAEKEGLSDRLTFLHTDLLAYEPDTDFDVSFGIGLFDYISDPLPVMRRMRELTRDKSIMAFPRFWTWRAPVRKARLTMRGCPVYFFTKERVEDCSVRPATRLGSRARRQAPLRRGARRGKIVVSVRRPATAGKDVSTVSADLRRIAKSSKTAIIAYKIIDNWRWRRRLRRGIIESENGATHRAFSLEESLAYVNAQFDDYVRYGGLASEQLRGLSVFELGFGDNIGVALRFLGRRVARRLSRQVLLRPRRGAAPPRLPRPARRSARGARPLDEAIDLSAGIKVTTSGCTASTAPRSKSPKSCAAASSTSSSRAAPSRTSTSRTRPSRRWTGCSNPAAGCGTRST